MQTSYRESLEHFDIQSLPDLDAVVLGALELLEGADLPEVTHNAIGRPFVIGSGNAEVTGRLLFENVDAVYTNESTYKDDINRFKEVLDSAVIISASGGKHSLEISRALRESSIKAFLYTNNPLAPAREYIDEENIFVFPKNREPYTYNTSTYMSMLASYTHEDARVILSFIEESVASCIRDDLASFDAFCLLVPSVADRMRPLCVTKFDELFGPRIVGRVFTYEQMKHAKTVVPSETELFISFGENNTASQERKNNLAIPLPEKAGYVALMAITYYVIGQIQKQHPPYFKEHISEYVKDAGRLFNQTIPVIVE